MAWKDFNLAMLGVVLVFYAIDRRDSFWPFMWGFISVLHFVFWGMDLAK